MNGNGKGLASRVADLVNTSVQDMQSSLWGYTTAADLEVLEYGLRICKRRGESTKAQILTRKVKKLRKELQS